MKLAIFTYGRERFLFDGGRTELNTVKDARVQDVDAGIDAVANKLNRFLHKAVNAGWVIWLMYNDTVFGRFLHLCYHNSSFVSVFLVESS